MIDVLIFEQLESCLDIRTLGIGITTYFCKSNLQANPCLACHTPFRDSGNEASIRVPRMINIFQVQ
jgi:hypothetical protein